MLTGTRPAWTDDISAEAALAGQLERGDVAGASATALHMDQSSRGYADIADYQTKQGQFDSAKATIRRIAVGSYARPLPGLIQRCSALITLSSGLYTAGRNHDAASELRVAMLDAGHIPGIFAEMGEGFGIDAARQWTDIAALQIRERQHGPAKASLDAAERLAVGSGSPNAAVILGRIEADRRTLGDKIGAATAHREWRLAKAGAYGQTGDQSLKIFGYVQVDAEDGNVAAVLKDIDRPNSGNDPVDLLCFAARTMGRTPEYAARRERILETARHRRQMTKDPNVKACELAEIAALESTGR